MPVKEGGAGDDGSYESYKALASSLAGIHAPLMALGKKQFEEKAQSDRALGEQYYAQYGDRQSAKDFHEQYKELPYNAHIKEGWLKARASNEALALRTQLVQEYTTATVKDPITGEDKLVSESDDPNAFENWLKTRTREFISTNMGNDSDPRAFSEIFLPQVEDTVSKLTGEHINYRQQQKEFKAIAENSKLISNIVSEHINEDGAFFIEEEAKAGLIAKLSTVYRGIVMAGVGKEKTRKMMSTAIQAIAERNEIKDIDGLLYILGDIELDDGIRIKDDPEMHMELQNSLDKASRERYEREEREKREREEKRQEVVEEVFKDMYNRFGRHGIVDVNAVMDELVNGKAEMKVDEAHSFIMQLQALRNVKDYQPPVDYQERAWAKEEREYNAQLKFLTEIETGAREFNANGILSANYLPAQYKARMMASWTESKPTADKMFANITPNLHSTLQATVFNGMGFAEGQQLPASYNYMVLDVKREFMIRAQKDPDLMSNTPRAMLELNQIVREKTPQYRLDAKAISNNPMLDVRDTKSVRRAGREDVYGSGQRRQELIKSMNALPHERQLEMLKKKGIDPKTAEHRYGIKIQQKDTKQKKTITDYVKGKK